MKEINNTLDNCEIEAREQSYITFEELLKEVTGVSFREIYKGCLKKEYNDEECDME